MRFHWRHPSSCLTVVYRLTRASFGLTCPPFLLGGVLQQHLEKWKHPYPELVKEIRDGLYIDDLMAGEAAIKETKGKKGATVEVFQDVTFKVHKWHSNASEL